MKSKIPIPVFVFVIAIATFSRMEAASFTPLGFPESVDDGAYGVSDDGTFVGGYASKEETGPDYVRLRRQAVRWTVARAGADAVGLGLLPEAKESRVFGMSADGQVLVGESSGRAFRWSAAEGMIDLGTMPAKDYFVAWGVSGDGSVVVGSGDVGGNELFTEPFMWTSNIGMKKLGFLPGDSRGEALAVSKDGQVIVGYSRGDGPPKAFIRGQDGIMRALDVLGEYSSTFASGVSSDGSVVVGQSGWWGSSEAFRWTQSGGFEFLGVLDGSISSYATAVSGDGTLVVGYSLGRKNDKIISRAFIWDSARGMRDIQSTLKSEYDLDLPGWTLDEATAISSDGTAIVGKGTNPHGNRQAWIVRLTETHSTRSGRWKVDASLPQPEFKKTTLPPRAMSDGKGGVYVWGFNNLIHNANGQRSGVVIKINATNGQHDTSFALSTSLIEVLAGQVDSEGRLYMSGSAPGDATDEGRNFRIFRILTNGTVDASYTSPAFSAEPRWFRLLSDGKLMVSQPGISGIGGTKVDKTVRLNSDGTLDQPFSKNTPNLDWVGSFAPPIVDQQGRILLGGFAGGATGPLVRLLPTGQIDSSFVPSGFSILNASVRGIGLQSNGKIVLAGRFSTPKTGAASYGIVRLNDNGSLDTTFTLVTTTAAGFANALNPSGRARLLEVLSGDKIVAIGDRGLRRFNPDGSLDNSYPGLNFDADHYWMDVSPDGGVLVPSDFAGGNLVGSNKVVGIIKLKPDGKLDTGFRPPSFQEEVFPRALGLQSDGDLILSGGGWTGFDSVSGVSVLGVAKLDTRLALNTAYRPFDSLTDFRGISSQVMAPDDALFANVNLGLDDFNIENRIFKVGASGLKDPAFSLPGSGVSDLYWVNGLLVGSGNSAQAIVDRAPLVQRYNSSGSVDVTYSGIGSADLISQVFLTSGAIAKPPFDLENVSVIKSGSFSIVAGLPDGRSYAAICHSTNYTQHRIVRLKVDGSFDPTFEPVVFGVLSAPRIDYPAISRGGVEQQIETWYPPSSPFTSGSVLTNGGLLLCGSFTNVQGFGTPGIVRINPDGSIDKTFNVGIGAGYSNRPGLTASIYKVLHLQNGQTLVLGTFDRFNKYPANGLVILESDGSVSPESPSDVALPPSAFEGSTVDAYAMGTDRVLLVGPFVHNHSAWPTAVTQLVRETDPVQSVQLQIGQDAGSIRVGWPSGLGWVQPQRQTDLAAPVWQDLGAPTTANTLSETAGPTTGFYRLKFLPPTITQQPMAKSVAAGTDVTLQVGVMGTEPMAYQWYKGNVRLTGKTGAQLSLSGVTSADAGNYSVWITNRAGTAASQGALLTVTTPTVRPSGIYMGNFSGQSDNGGFAAMIRSDGTAFVVGYNTPQEEGLFIPTWTLPADGTFTIKTVQKGTITGVFTSSAVAGTFSNSTGQSGAFSGNRKPDSGIHAKSAGYYAGTYDGAASGSAYAIIAADGSLFFYSVDNPLSPTADGDGGGFGVINAANALSGTTVPNGFQLQGTINPTTGVLTGTYSLGGTALGTFRVVRTQTP